MAPGDKRTTILRIIGSYIVPKDDMTKNSTRLGSLDTRLEKSQISINTLDVVDIQETTVGNGRDA